MKVNCEGNSAIFGNSLTTTSDSLLVTFLKPHILIPVVFGIGHLLVNYFVYQKEKTMAKGSPSFYPFINISICTLFFAISPLINDLGLANFKGWQSDCGIYAFFERIFIALLPMTMFEILMETFQEKFVENNKKMQIRIFISVWILVLWFAVPGIWLEEYLNKYGECTGRFNRLLNYFGRVCFIELIKMCAMILYLASFFIHLKRSRFRNEPYAVGMESSIWRRHYGFLHVIFVLIFWLIPSFYFVIDALMKPINFEFTLSDGIMNGYQNFYWVQLILLPFSFYFARDLFTDENSENPDFEAEQRSPDDYKCTFVFGESASEKFLTLKFANSREMDSDLENMA